MRTGVYGLFELVAWPAAVWGAAEAALRLATGTFDGFATATATGALASLTIVACRMRVAQLPATER